MQSSPACLVEHKHSRAMFCDSFGDVRLKEGKRLVVNSKGGKTTSNQEQNEGLRYKKGNDR
jgi:hypothetical protein